MSALLEIRDVVKRFGGLVAVDQMSLDVEVGQIAALIGPNGAGKTTLFNCVTGFLPLDGGAVRLDGDDITKLDVHQRARAGIGRTFQRLEVFTAMTVAENLQVAAEVALRRSILVDMFRIRHRPDDEVAAEVDAALGLLRLEALRDEIAGDLSTGHLRRLEVARAICGQPRVLLLDEPASGLDEHETDELADTLRRVADSGIGVLLVEHDVELVMEVSEHVYVMDFGHPVADGPPEQIAEDPEVQAVYLGVENPGSGRAEVAV